MSFEDIDTPVSESELSGDVAELETAVVENAAPKPDPVAAPEAQTDEAEPTQERAPVIPRARFDEVNAKLHAEREEVERLRAELASVQQQRSTPEDPPSDMKALIREAKEALFDGDLDKAAELEYRIQQETQRAATAEAEQNVIRGMSEREAKSAISSTVGKIVADFPFLDSSSPDANQEAIGDVIEWRDFYMAKGKPAHVAIQLAADKVAPMYAAADPAAAVPQDSRKAAALARNAIDSAAQAPANVAGVGNRAAPSQPKVETQKDWEKLSDADREALLQ